MLARYFTDVEIEGSNTEAARSAQARHSHVESFSVWVAYEKKLWKELPEVLSVYVGVFAQNSTVKSSRGILTMLGLKA